MQLTRQTSHANQDSLAALALALIACVLCHCSCTCARASIFDAAHKHSSSHWSLSADLDGGESSALKQQHHHHQHSNEHHFQHKGRTWPQPQSATTQKMSHRQQTTTNTTIAGLRLASLRNKCALAERELDRCSAQLIGLGQTGATGYPDSMQELDSVYCPRFRETVACVRNNTECFRPFERQIINWILTSTRRMNYKRCKSENEKLRFLKLTQSCFAAMRSPMDDCMARYIGQLDAVADYERDQIERLVEREGGADSGGGDDIQIQLACCANRRFKQCVMRSARQMCQVSASDSLKKLRRANSVSSQRVARKQLARLARDTMEDLKSTLDEMALTGPDFVCTGVDEHFCRSRFDGRFSSRGARHKSIVPAMIKIYANK